MDARKLKGGGYISVPTSPQSDSPNSKESNNHHHYYYGNNMDSKNNININNYQQDHNKSSRRNSRHFSDITILQRRHSTDSTINNNLNLSKKKSNSYNGSVYSRVSRISSDPYDDLDELNFDVDSAIHPIGSKSYKSESKVKQFIIKYFTLAIILLPSIIAITIPSNNSTTNTSEDLANLITDCFMIILVSCAIKFTIEWPWNWSKQLRETKLKLINHINSKLINQKSLNEQQLLTSENKLLNDEILCNRIGLVKKILYYEKLSILLAVLLSVFGSVLMVWSRNNIIIEESRKKIVFNNFNIGLFQFWQLFRVIVAFAEKLQRDSTEHMDEFESENNEYGLLTEHNLNLFLPHQSVVQNELSLIQFLKVGFEQLFQLIHISMDTSKQEQKILHQELVDTILQKERQQNDSKFDNLQEHSQLQMELIEKLLNTQSNEFSNINSNITKLESAVSEIKKTKKSRSSLASSSQTLKNASNMYVKPFPLNLNLEEGEPISSTLKANKMKTIFEEDMSRTSSYQNENVNEIDKPQSPLSKSHSFEIDCCSLHGVPLASNVEILRGKNSNQIIEDIGYGAANQPISVGSPLFGPLPVEIDEANNEENEILNKKRKRGSFSTLRRTITYIHDIRNEISLIDIIKDPFVIRKMVQNKILPKLLQSIQSEIHHHYEKLCLIKVKSWELCNTYIFSNFDFILSSLQKFDEGLQPVRQLKNFLILIFTKIPLNLLEIYFEIMIFLPKIWLKFLVINPIHIAQNYFSGNEDYSDVSSSEQIPLRRSTSNKKHSKSNNDNNNNNNNNNFKGMKQLHLSRSDNGRTQMDEDNIIYEKRQMRMRDILLQKILDNSNLESNTKFDAYGFPKNTPVNLYAE
ncbi:uncharacterized protein RJT21DRAFT_141520 [Scheffersomyces amazonensis]|uniref:uncharacterized protein n=1 Tax=Scheffersomyces amazonensis TaxID=1078765 RepID=UPI00315D4D1A